MASSSLFPAVMTFNGDTMLTETLEGMALSLKLGMSHGFVVCWLVNSGVGTWSASLKFLQIPSVALARTPPL